MMDHIDRAIAQTVERGTGFLMVLPDGSFRHVPHYESSLSVPLLEDAPFIASGMRECAASAGQEQATLAARLKLGADMITRLYALLAMTREGERAANDELLGRWQDIGNAPEDTDVLVYWPVLDEKPIIARYDGNVGRWALHGCCWFTAPIKWMPLPPVPA